MDIFEAVITRAFLIATGIVPLLLFGLQLRRRKYFPWRLAAFIVLSIAIDVGVSLIDFSPFIWLQCIVNILKFLVSGLMLWMVFDEKILIAFFCCVSAKCTMHLAECLTKIIFDFTIKSTILSIFIYAVVYAAIYFLFAKKLRSEDCKYLNKFKFVLFLAITLIVTDVVVLYFNATVEDMSLNVYMFCFVTIICVIMLFLQYNLLAESKHLLEDAVIRSLREKEREQYESSKQTVNLIAIRQHDLKNMLQSRAVALSEEEKEKIGKLLDDYDLPFKTGNRTLDAILMEKNLVCKQKNIRLEVLLDGKPMDFIGEMDLYSLFLNALNNAIESAEKIEDESKRVIWLKSYLQGSLLFINISNYYNKVVQTSGGFETTKADKANHGFGLQSMKLIVEKYGGKMSILAEKEIFSLGFVIPTVEKN